MKRNVLDEIPESPRATKVRPPARTDGTYMINYDICKGCGICAEECPSDAIEMVEEDQ